MWSDRYYYLNIYKDENLSQSFDTAALRDFLMTVGELRKVSDFSFGNQSGQPFIQLSLLHAANINSWSEKDAGKTTTNLIAVVCAKGHPDDFKKPAAILIKIAAFLKWTFVDEHTDNGKENAVLWKPE